MITTSASLDLRAKALIIIEWKWYCIRTHPLFALGALLGSRTNQELGSLLVDGQIWMEGIELRASQAFMPWELMSEAGLLITPRALNNRVCV